MNQGITLKDLLSFGSIGATIFFGAMWLGALEADVKALKGSTVTAERIVRLETNMSNLEKSNGELKGSIDTLTREIRRTRNN